LTANENPRAAEKEIICIVCAKGCRSLVCEDEEGLKVKGPLCKNGQAYWQGIRDPAEYLPPPWP
jgi:CxxC motif-containing protein